MGARALMLVLMGAAFLTFFDRAQLPPLMSVIADDFGVHVSDIGNALMAYVIAYASGQLLWSVVSSRIGRVRVLVVSTALGVIGNLITVLAGGPIMLILGRVLAGLAFGATVPAVLVYFADTMRMRERGVAAANLAAALSLGMTVGTVAAAFAGEWLNWRVVFGVTAAGGAVLTLLLIRVPNPPGAVPQRVIPAFVRILRNRWALGILALTLVEGALLVGIISYLPAALTTTGSSVIAAGLATALFGLAVIAWTQLVKVLVGRWPAWMLLATGGVGTVLAYALLALHLSVFTVTIATLLLGYSWASAHTQMQTWMTDAALDARPVGMALFATALFAGGALGAAIGNAAVVDEAFTVLFVIATVLSVAFTIAAAISRARYRLREH